MSGLWPSRGEQLSSGGQEVSFLSILTPPFKCLPAKTAFSVSLSLHDTRAVIAEPSAQCRTHASAARFNGRKLETKSRAAAKGHLAPSAPTQTMEDLWVFSLQLPPGAPR